MFIYENLLYIHLEITYIAIRETIRTITFPPRVIFPVDTECSEIETIVMDSINHTR